MHTCRCRLRFCVKSLVFTGSHETRKSVITHQRLTIFTQVGEGRQSNCITIQEAVKVRGKPSLLWIDLFSILINTVKNPIKAKSPRFRIFHKIFHTVCLWSKTTESLPKWGRGFREAISLHYNTWSSSGERKDPIHAYCQ